MPTCQALIQQGDRKGQPCGKDTDAVYCGKHKRQAILDKAYAENIRYCDISRGCFTILDDHQSKCTRCLHKARIQDRKRDGEKRQDPNLCLDCGRIMTEADRARGKHDKLLRRCTPCYAKLQAQEAKREKRVRNYKAEAFRNKHVIWNHYVKSAKNRKIDFSISKARFEELILQPCTYCDRLNAGEVNGIDRIDNNKGYLDGNVVSCCETCNMLKGTQHPQEFIDKLQAIRIYHTTQRPIAAELIEKWSTTYRTSTTPSYQSYSKRANTRNIIFQLTESEFSAIRCQPCYLCGLTENIGIDRVDNTKGYCLDNCKPCCGHCNLMKRDRTYQDILVLSQKIFTKYAQLNEFLANHAIEVRSSKTESRLKMDHPQTQEKVPLSYKPVDEIIQPRASMPADVVAILEN